MRIALFVVLMQLASVGQADVYKCVKDGRATFQETPCDPASAAPIRMARKSSLVGCFEFRFHSLSEGFSYSERMDVVAEGARYFLTGTKDKKRMELRPAKPSEIEWMRKGGAEGIDEGLVIAALSGEGERPVGIYRSGDLIFGYFFLANGPGTRVSCQ